MPRVVQSGQPALTERVTLTGGDFYADALPAGANLAWVGAIAHQNSREQNRVLYAKVHEVLVDGGRLMIRDVVMDDSRTHPVAGAMFAINMLVATQGGGTYTFNEFRADLMTAGFIDIRLLIRDEFMNSVICAKRAPAL